MADLCVNCHMCRLECPASVDIPKLMIEGKGAYVQINGLDSSDWVMSRVDRLSWLGSLLSPLANWAITNRPARWLMEKTLGVAQGRKLPRFALAKFHADRRAAAFDAAHAARRSQSAVFCRHLCQLSRSAIGRSAGGGAGAQRRSRSTCHPGQQSSGMPMISLGALGKARQVAEHNVALLAEAVRQGYHIVATEPSAALALTHEYPALLDDDDARLVAANTSEACTYLVEAAPGGQPATRLAAGQRRARLSHALPSEGACKSARRARTCCG